MPVNAGSHGDYLLPNTNGAEGSVGNAQWIMPTPTGFIATNAGLINMFNAAREYIYIAIRRSDGYVGKPPELGTDVFNIDLDGTNNGDPSWVSGFPVDMQFLKDRAGTSFPWFLSTRLTQGKYLSTQSTADEIASSVYQFDYPNGWGNYSSANGLTSWQWKRHAGMDVVTYKGSNSSHNEVPHNLGKVPEMLWIKARDRSALWVVYHKGLNGGTNPNTYYLALNGTGAESAWNWSDSTPPTSTHFTVSSGDKINFDENYLALLFASVDGISKVGSYTGSSSAQTITTGFQPRFLIIKRRNSSQNWLVFDTARGWGSGNDKSLKLNTSDTQGTWDAGAPTSTGFTLVGGIDTTNNSAGEYIYYAHA